MNRQMSVLDKIPLNLLINVFNRTGMLINYDRWNFNLFLPHKLGYDIQGYVKVHCDNGCKTFEKHRTNSKCKLALRRFRSVFFKVSLT